jgi:hypothetical protein
MLLKNVTPHILNNSKKLHVYRSLNCNKFQLNVIYFEKFKNK